MAKWDYPEFDSRGTFRGDRQDIDRPYGGQSYRKRHGYDFEPWDDDIRYMNMGHDQDYRNEYPAGRVNYIPDNDDNRQSYPAGSHGYEGDRPEPWHHRYDSRFHRYEHSRQKRFADYGDVPSNLRQEPRHLHNRDYPDRYERDWWDRTRDEVSSWFGNEKAERRRELDREVPGGNRGKGPRGYHRSEERIMEDVCERLTYDDRLDASDIEVKVENDEVILTGTVTSRSARRRAEDLAGSIPGVHDVENRLKVVLPGPGQAETMNTIIRNEGNMQSG